jgi:hypothetical protein
MGQKQLPPEPPPCHGVQNVRTHDIPNAGRSHLAAVRLAMPERLIQPIMTAGGPRAGHGPSEPRGPPITDRCQSDMDRADGCIHRP